MPLEPSTPFNPSPAATRRYWTSARRAPSRVRILTGILVCQLLGLGAVALGPAVPASAQPARPKPPVARPPAAKPSNAGTPTTATGAAEVGTSGTEAATADPTYDDPFEAYDAGAWDEALEGFLDRRVERPDDPAEALNVGSAHYQKGDYEEAARAFGSVAAAQGEDGRVVSPELREKAFYNLGNTAYRQGKLKEAVEHYRRALDLDPDDQDAKLNLELVQREIERRQQEQKQKQQGQGGQGGQDQNKDRQDQKQESSPDQQKQDSQQGQSDQGQGKPQSQQEQQGQQQEKKPPSGDRSSQGDSDREQAAPKGPDQDGDGLPDRVEREGDNPTDPANPDTDGDGLPDGAEDLNANGRVDPGETDPNRSDTDGDGIPDGEEQTRGGAAGAAQLQPTEGLTEEEALRYLMALEEVRPELPPDEVRAGQPTRSSKDW